LLDAPFLSDKVKEVIQFIADIRQSGSDAVNVTYGAATYKTKRGKTRAKNLPISNRDALIYGLTVSPVGTITANILDLSLLRSKIQRLWSGDSRLHNLFDGPDGMYNDALTYVNALGGDVPTAQVLGSAEKRNHLNKMLGVRNVKGNPELPDTYNLKEADHPWRSFRLDRFVKARKLEDVKAQFSQQAYEMAQGNFSPGQTGVIRESDIARFSPAPDNPNASLRDFVGKKVQVLTSDLSTGKDKKVDGITVSFRGGPAYLEMFDGWAFTNEGSAKAFRTRWERDGKPLIGITSMLPNNHLNSKLARRYYAAKWRELVETGKIAESTVNKHLRAAMKRVVSGKNALTSDQRKMIANVKTHHDFAKVFEMIPWKAAPTVYEKLAGKTLPIPAKRQEALGVDLDSIAEATREPAYADVGPGHLLAIAEYNGSDPVYKPDLNENYPWMVELKEKAFLDEFHEVTGMTSREDVQTKSGKPNTAVLMGAGVTLDKLHSGDVRFSPAKLDTDHAKAVQSGDMETAQRLVDEAAKKAGYGLVVYHGTPQGFEGNVIDTSAGQRGNLFGLYTTTSPRAAWWYATHGGIGEYIPKQERLTRRPGLTPSIKKFYVDGSKNFSGPIDSDLLFEVVNKRPDKWEFLGLDLYDDYDTFKDAWNDNIEARLAEDDWFVGNDTEAMPQDIAPLFSDPEIGREYLEKGGYESVSYYDAETNDVAPDSETVVILTPKTAKSADPATYDDNGNLIPLSERFNIQSDDIRFSPARTLNKRGGAIYTTEQGHRAVQTSSRAGVRVYDKNGKRIGPVFQSVEKAERYLQGKAK
jgi:hypothetical protein